MKKFTKGFGIFFATFFVFAIVATFIFPENSEGKVELPSWYALSTMILSIGVAVVLSKNKSDSKKSSKESLQPKQKESMAINPQLKISQQNLPPKAPAEAMPNEIVITRKKSAIGSLKTHKVFLDNNFVGLLKNGETLKITGKSGQHTLRFDAFGKQEGFLNVYLQEGKPGISIFVALGMSNGQLHLKVTAGIAGDQAINEYQQNVEYIAFSAQQEMESCKEADHISIFIDSYDTAIAELQKLVDMGESPIILGHIPSYAIVTMKKEFQWHLCDAIARSKERAIDEINNKYKNSREFQRKCANVFYDEVVSYKDRFSEDSLDFADKAIQEIFRAAREVPPPPLCSNPSEENDEGIIRDPVAHELSKVDCMEGHAFEYWCAELLETVGFSDVEVTQGSGDQGVDVIAVKDGIRYAIQCKCYASDLGNKPIQEVNTGKSIYHCQIGAVMTNRYFTAGAKEAAEATGILLWDRDKLKEMLQQRKE